MAGLLAREPAAISEFLERTHHPVYCLACRLTLDPEERRDWAHEVLLGILDDLSRGKFVYRRPGGFWAWFRRRAWFRLLDEYRRRRRLGERFVSDEAGDAGEEMSDQSRAANPEQEFERARTRAVVLNCLEALANSDQRLALQLLLFEELSYDEIARAMSSPLNTIRAWIRRGRLSLRLCVAEALGLIQGKQTS